MPLGENEKMEARAALALALELNEPESLVESLRRLCARKAAERWQGDNERERWHNAAMALESVSQELERANAPQKRADDAPAEQTGDNSGC